MTPLEFHWNSVGMVERFFSGKLYKKERRKYFESLDQSKIVDNKTILKNIEPLFSETGKVAKKVMLVDKGDKIISGDILVSEEINFFSKMLRKILI